MSNRTITTQYEVGTVKEIYATFTNSRDAHDYARHARPFADLPVTVTTKAANR